MGVSSRLRDIRPPLPAPTESMDEGGTTSAYETDVATNVTTRTDKSSYEVPEDGSPITIPTNKITSGGTGDVRVSKHDRHKSQTSLLIEYFETSKKGEKSRSKPSVRVKVTPSSRKKSGSHGSGHDAIQITGIGKDRKPSYTRRISLGSNRHDEALNVPAPTEGTEVSQSSGSVNPLEIEVLNSDVSGQSRGLMHNLNESNVSSMPPDSMLEGSVLTDSELSRAPDYYDEEDDITVKKEDYLEAPKRSRSRSTSQDRITQKVMEKLGQTSSKSYKSSKSKSDRSLGQEYDQDGYPIERRRRSSKSHRYDDDTISGADGSSVAQSQVSYRSGSDVSKGSRVTNNPKLLEMVEDTVKRIILPEINAIKRDQSVRSSEHSRRESYDDYSSLHRRVSKSSSSPNISSKPKVVLNREGDDPGTVLSRGDSERKQRKSSREHRPSSRRSSEGKSYDYDDESTVREKSSRSSNKIRDAAAAGTAGGILTAGALKMHDSQSTDRERDRERERRKKRSSKSRSNHSRSASIVESTEDAYTIRSKEDIPPMPMASAINDSEMTRESILSVDTEVPASPSRTPIREVSRGSLSTLTSRTPTRTPVGSRGLGMSHGNQSIDSPKSPGGRSHKDRVAALAAAGVVGAAGAGTMRKDSYDRTVDADGYGDSSPITQRQVASPVQSVSSLKKNYEESLIPPESRPISATSRSSAGRLREKSSLHSGASSPSSKLTRSRKQSQTLTGDDFVTPMERPDASFARESTPGTPNGESVDDWYERQHQLNEQYRTSLDEGEETRDAIAATTREFYRDSNRDSYQTNPYPQDEKRFTQFTDDSLDAEDADVVDEEQDVRALGANPQFMRNSFAAESNVASLMEPSFVSSNAQSSQMSGGSATKGSFAARLRDLGQDSPGALYNGSTLSQSVPSQDRWAALSSRAKEMSVSSKGDLRSPQQSPAKSLRSQESQPVMGASGLPVADDPLPEIGHFDDNKSEISTNPSIIQGPLGGDVTGKDTWPYTPEPEQRELANKHSKSVKSDDGSKSGLKYAAVGAGAAALAGGAYAATRNKSKQPMAEDDEDSQRALTPDYRRNVEYIDREATPTSPAAFRDEGYVTENTRSAGALTPRAEQGGYSRKDVDEYNRVMNAQDLGDDDPFTGNTQQHARVVSGNSHGMSSPLYDAATGKGQENVQSKDIVALMDHLTVRDAQRNARDTEILVSLVRSAAEMRQNFDEMKKFIVDQDRMIMRDAQRGNEQVKSAVLGGPRAMPSSAPRTPRQSEEDIQTKRKGVLRRALKGLTGGKSANDLTRVEDMLNQILDNVEDLKYQQGGPSTSGGDARGGSGYGRSDSLGSYEQMRNRTDDSGYEPEGQAGTNSTPSNSGFLATTPRAEKYQFHSGYDGRRNSENRVSTVLEGDEEELEPHEGRVLDNQFENNDGMMTPTQERQRQRGLSPDGTPYHVAEIPLEEKDVTPRSADKQRKHKSNSSSVFGGIPKISRWSKTTSSSAAPDPATLDSPVLARGQRPESLASKSRSTLGGYDDDVWACDDRHSTRSAPREQADLERRSVRSQASKLSRTPSPLIPSETSSHRQDEYYDRADDRAVSPIQDDDYLDDAEFDDPKYQAHRNSLLLQHPQPRQGPTGRHQNTLESRAYQFDQDHEDASATSSNLSQRTVSDDVAMFGSSGTAALSKHRFSQMSDNMSPISPAQRTQNDAPLIPQKAPAIPPKIRHEEPEPEEDDWEPNYSNSGFSRGGHYSSPFGSGHLLEPIEEVRYSLETDGGHSPEPDAQPQTARAVDMRSGGLGGARKITGPRPMKFGNGTVRRKPVGSVDDDGY